MVVPFSVMTMMMMIAWMEPGAGLQIYTGKMTTASSEHLGRPKTMTTTTMSTSTVMMTMDSSDRLPTAALSRISHTSTSMAKVQCSVVAYIS